MKPFKFVIPVSIDDYLTPKSMYPVFQPVLSLKTSAVAGYEAFIRLDVGKDKKSAGASGGEPVFSPEDAFRRVKETGNLLLFDKNCFKSAAKTARAIGLRKKLFINICALSFFDKDFQSDYIARHLAKYAIEPSSVVLEISEKDFDGLDAEETEKIVKAAENFKAAGIQIALDNFGSRDFGLKKIYQLNPDYVKLDISVVRGINADSAMQGMARTLVSFCSGIGSRIVACGVENGDELKTLAALGVDAAQGFFIAEPERFFCSASSKSYSIVSSYLYKKDMKTVKDDKQGGPDEKVRNDSAERAQDKSSGNKNEISKRQPSEEQGKSGPVPQMLRIGNFCVPGVTFLQYTPVPELLQFFQVNTDCQLAVVVDLKKKIQGDCLALKVPRAFLFPVRVQPLFKKDCRASYGERVSRDG